MPEKTVYTLSKHKVPDLINKLIKDKAEVWAPVKGQGWDSYLGRIGSAKEMTADYVNGYLGGKRYVFPQIEELFSFKQGKNGLTITQPEQAPRAVVWGIRPCDMSAVNYFDSFFGLGTKSGPDWKSGDPLPDPLYQQRRERAVFITIACNTAGPKCFCVCTDSGPFLSKGYDIQLTDLGDYYLAEVGSTRGQEFVKEFKSYFGSADPADQSRRRQLEVEAEKTFQQPVSFFAKAMRRMDAGKVDRKFWEKVAGYCIGCGGCIYVCPMCSCFDVDDRMESETGGQRYRSWDTCDFVGFTREVSGHNPRASRADRRQRWFYHKVSMDYLEKNPVIGCVGCGRCVIACPGEVDMPTVIRWMRKVE
jgi:ferredoxin